MPIKPMDRYNRASIVGRRPPDESTDEEVISDEDDLKDMYFMLTSDEEQVQGKTKSKGKGKGKSLRNDDEDLIMLEFATPPRKYAIFLLVQQVSGVRSFECR
jgi:hypothetical protein